MSKERLEEIKNERWENLRTSQILHVNWLIEQAERAQELEDLVEHRTKMLKYSRGKNKRYREALEEVLKSNISTWGFHQIARIALEESK